jgi:hypothetical protein
MITSKKDSFDFTNFQLLLIYAYLFAVHNRNNLIITKSWYYTLHTQDMILEENI